MDTMLSAQQFLIFVKECKLSAVGISFNVCLETFVTVNQDDIEQFLQGNIPYTAMPDAMQMDYDEFTRAYGCSWFV